MEQEIRSLWSLKKLRNLLLTQKQVSVMVKCWEYKLYPLPTSLVPNDTFLPGQLHMQIQLLLVSTSCCVHKESWTPPTFHMSRPWWKNMGVCGREMRKLNFPWNNGNYSYLSPEALESAVQLVLPFSSALPLPTAEAAQLWSIREQQNLVLCMPPSSLCPVLHS